VHFAAPDRLIWVAAVGVVLWAVWAFSSELMLNLRLHHQVDKLRAQNAQLAEANARARHDLESVGSATAFEAQARNQGLSRPGEQVFIIAPTPAAKPSGSPGTPADGAVVERAGDDGGVWKSFVRWWRNRWH